MIKHVVNVLDASDLFRKVVGLSKGFAGFGNALTLDLVEQPRGLSLSSVLNWYLREEADINCSVFIVPSDLPLLGPRDLKGFLCKVLKPDIDALLILSQDGKGTNGLFLRNPRSISIAFGQKSSFELNKRALVKAELTYDYWHSLGFALDVDTIEDLHFALYRGLSFRPFGKTV